MKRCSGCDTEKELHHFHKDKSRKDGYRDHCKECIAEYQKQYRLENREEILERKKKYFQMHKDVARRYQRNKIQNDIQYKIASNLRKRINKAVKISQKVGSAVNDLGCSIEFFKNYIENKFQSGMTWNNYGEWELDHIKPLVSFNLTDRTQFLKACHYTNYQPLWWQDNLSKGAKIV